MKRKVAGIAICLLAAAGAISLVQAGDLEPPGSPAPTKTAVDETDPRTAIRTSDLPLTISSSGSYYLAEDISTGGDGIRVDASNVTIDLMGFSLSGGTGAGISVTKDAGENVTVRNGTVAGWNATGVDLSLGDSALVINVRAEGNGGRGIFVGSNSAVIDSTATQNTGSGIDGGFGSLITGCTSSGNSFGISVRSGSTVTACYPSNIFISH